MDSKQIFRTYNSKLELIFWFNEKYELAQNEKEIKWFYCGVGKDYKSKIVEQEIDIAFPDDEIYLCIAPNKSSLVLKSVAVKEIGNSLHKKEIGLMDKSLTKLISFSTIGVFTMGIIKEFPKSRLKPKEKPLIVKFYANITDESTTKIPDLIRNPLDQLAKLLSNNYGGIMENLWIDLELTEGRHHKEIGYWPFRFQKRISTSNSFLENYTYNVAHYSVKPDFKKLRELPEKSICTYVFGLFYESTQVLIEQEKKLGGFNATKFRSDFLIGCENLGITLNR